MKKLLTILIALTIFLLISCNIFAASETSSTETPLISNESDSLKCNVYIIYPKQFYKLFCPIYVNGLLETSLKVGTYVCCNVSPGKTKVMYFVDTYSEIAIDTYPGKSYYIKAQPKNPSFSERMAHGGLQYCEFTVLDETEGKKLLAECTVVDWSRNNQKQ